MEADGKEPGARRVTRSFPDGFLWGSSGSAHQTEGNNSNSDWWRHELQPDSNAAEPSGTACDSFHRFDEDWKLVASSGQNAVRFSIEWARIEPEPGVFDHRQLDHYREVIGSARDLGLETFVTLHHFTHPIWFADKGGWEEEESVQIFRRYTGRVCDGLGDLLQTVNTINEPQIVASMGWVLGYFPPRKTDLPLGHQVTANLIRAHGAAVEAVRDGSDARVGLTLSIMDYVSVDESEEARAFRDLTHWSMVGVYLEALSSGKIAGLMVPDDEVRSIAGTDDFIGVQYYTRVVADPAALSGAAARKDAESQLGGGPGERVTQMGWVWHPEGLGKVIDEVAATGLPIYITESGIATEDDDERVEYVTLHLEQVHHAIARGTDVRGYFYWSYLDNFEWNHGFRPKFGLIACDRETFERRPKPSLWWYGGVAKRNAL
ncbi:MAG: glycoside hydrolase family 1 protein [Actinomycetota bacterium]